MSYNLLLIELFAQRSATGFPAISCLSAGNDLTLRHGSIGKALPGSTARVNALGSLEVFGRHVFMGLLHDPRGSKAAFTDDGWLCTGLRARITDGGYIELV